MCISIGLAPSSHPPGRYNRAFPSRDKSAPEKSTDVLIAEQSLSGTLYDLRSSVFKTRSRPSRRALPPSVFIISDIFITSEISGQFFMTVSSLVKSEAAIIGKTAFFAPEAVNFPDSGLPPFMIYPFILSPRRR